MRPQHETGEARVSGRAWLGLLQANGPSPSLPRLLCGVCLGVTLLAVALHVYYACHAGGLWRDEVSSVHLATLPTWGEMWRALDVPALFPAALRGWCAFGPGQTDFGLRLLGLIVGLGLLGTLWWNARVMGFGTPCISLGLLVANVTLVQWGDSLRAYGLGSLLMLLALGRIWALIQRPGRRQFLLASLAGILSVQCLFQNAFLLAAACAGGCVVCLRRRDLKTLLSVLGTGVAAAVSLLPYAAHVAPGAGSGWSVLRSGYQAPVAFANLSIALGSPMSWLRWIWLGLLLGTIAVGLLGLLDRNNLQRADSELRIFGAGTAAAGVASFFLFLKLANLPTQPWYFLPLMTFVALCMDAAFAGGPVRFPALGAGFAGLMVLVSLPAAVRQAGCRQTNIDLLANWLREHARPNDLILVYPWYYGVTFNHYYTGATSWTTVPSLTDHRLHRYDLLMEKMAAKDPLQDLIAGISRTLAGGNTLWIVGQLPPPVPGREQTPELPPAPNGPQGWFDEPYLYSWGRQLENFISGHAQRIQPVSVGPADCVSGYEDVTLFQSRGVELVPRAAGK